MTSSNVILLKNNISAICTTLIEYSNGCAFFISSIIGQEFILSTSVVASVVISVVVSSVVISVVVSSDVISSVVVSSNEASVISFSVILLLSTVHPLDNAITSPIIMLIANFFFNLSSPHIKFLGNIIINIILLSCIAPSRHT